VTSQATDTHTGHLLARTAHLDRAAPAAESLRLHGVTETPRGAETDALSQAAEIRDEPALVVGRFGTFTALELEALRPGGTSRRPEILAVRLVLVDEIDAETERRAGA
jgi:hypothetical protein